MKSKVAAVLAALAFATAANATPLHVTQAAGWGAGESDLQKVRYHRFGRYYFRCPVWYERTFWGAYRLYSPCSRKVTLGQY
jgi:hypothetical protein